jgi:hypothetical protein
MTPGNHPDYIQRNVQRNANLKTPHDMWTLLWTFYRCDSTLYYVFALQSFMRIEQGIILSKVSLSEFISELNRIVHDSQPSVAGASTHRIIVKDLFACEEVKQNFLLAWVTEFQDNVCGNLSSKDHPTYHEAKAQLLNLCTNHHSLSGASCKNSNPQH